VTSRVDALVPGPQKARARLVFGSARASRDGLTPFFFLPRLGRCGNCRRRRHPRRGAARRFKDADSIRTCDELGMAMVLTGVRHFKHLVKQQAPIL
jgi:phosphoribosylaminoimidazolecarboxamide formyltransferase/IMP cyclohydrolase